MIVTFLLATSTTDLGSTNAQLLKDYINTIHTYAYINSRGFGYRQMIVI